MIQRNTVFLFILILFLEIIVIYVSIRKNYRPIKGLVSFARNLFLPSEPRTMNEIDTIRFALDQLSSDNSRLDERVKSTLPVMRDNLLFELICEHYTTWEAFGREAAPYGLSFHYPLIMVAVISCETSEEPISSDAEYCRMKENSFRKDFKDTFSIAFIIRKSFLSVPVNRIFN